MTTDTSPEKRIRQRTAKRRVQMATRTVVRPKYPQSNSVTKLGNERVYLETERMSDVVVPGFHQRSAQGEIFNNPMSMEYVKEDTPLATIVKVRDNGKGDPYTTTYLMRPWCPVTPKHDDHSRLIDLAVTAAYANVSANEGNTLLWLGEFKETVKMLLDIGNGLKNLYNMTKAARKQWAKGQLSVEGQQKLTLALLYGILPLEESIAQFMEGLFRTKPDGRFTARGFQVATSSKSHTKQHPFYQDNAVIETVNYDIDREVTVRAGVLTDIDFDGVPWVSVIADPKSVISTAYALARLSFVIDWFINVGSTLKAWTPTAGTKELAAWYTVESTIYITGSSSYAFLSESKDLSISGKGEFKIEDRTKARVPISRSDLAIFPRLTLNLDLDKVFALVLLFAKVKK